MDLFDSAQTVHLTAKGRRREVDFNFLFSSFNNIHKKLPATTELNPDHQEKNI
jgi:hypothetical protein